MLVHAGENLTVSLSLPPDFSSQVCAVPIWNKVNVIWDGVKDKRAKLQVGTQMIKGEQKSPPLNFKTNSILQATQRIALTIL